MKILHLIGLKNFKVDFLKYKGIMHLKFGNSILNNIGTRAGVQ